MVAANSAYFAGGTPAAPDADVTDGLLDVITVGDGSKLSFVRVMLLASRGRHTRLAQVGVTRAASVTVSADRAMFARGRRRAAAVRVPAGRGRSVGHKSASRRAAGGQPGA